MKKILSTVICLGVALLAFTSCEDETEIKLLDTPVVTLSPSSVTLSAEATSNYTINYSVTNPADGASISASADASWITGIDSSVSGQIRFSVSANSSTDMRTANVTLTYSYDDGTVIAKAAVVQYGTGDPLLTVDPNAVVADAMGGTYSFGYVVENADGETLDCATDVDWITDFDYSEYGTVYFTVAASEAGALRTATIDVSYGALSKEVTVIQDRVGDTSLRVSPSSIVAQGGGGSYSFNYTLRFPVEGEPVNITADVNWITNITDKDATVTFTVATNEGATRVGVITVAHAGLEKTVTVTQGADISAYIGTYSASGYGRISGGYGNATWDMYITDVDGVAYAYCLTPYAGGLDITTAGVNYWATVDFGTNGEIIIPSQVCPGRVNSGNSTYYFGYTPCTEYEDGSFYYSSTWPDLTYTPTGTDTWESDYGVFAGGWTSTSISTFVSYFGVTAPTMTLTKTSDTVPAAVKALSMVKVDEVYVDFLAE